MIGSPGSDIITGDNGHNILRGFNGGDVLSGLGGADVLLGDMANLMRRCVGESEVAGRLGEHTFGVLIVQRSAEDTRQLSDKLRKGFEERIFDIGKQSISLTVSVGGTAMTTTA